MKGAAQVQSIGREVAFLKSGVKDVKVMVALDQYPIPELLVATNHLGHKALCATTGRVYICRADGMFWPKEQCVQLKDVRTAIAKANTVYLGYGSC